MARSPRKKSDHRARKRDVNATGLTVAIVGRPNVGKSTLFNRLIGRRSALVHDRPGVTRDRREGAAQIGDLAFTAVDTAGFEDAGIETLEGRAGLLGCMTRPVERSTRTAAHVTPSDAPAVVGRS